VILGILHELPESVSTLPEHGAWQYLCVRVVSAAPAASNSMTAVLLHIFQDVHALITSPQQLLHFRQLPYLSHQGLGSQ
jgi:hypothetical protein